jgi:oligopeptidase B
MGAIANMRPDLFKCILAEVPAVDVLNNLLIRSIDNSAAHFGLYGDPNIKEYYDYIKSFHLTRMLKNRNIPRCCLPRG